ncbi:hypothetical protein T484DRAFT_1802444, partial [Baffinella frigidus]
VAPEDLATLNNLAVLHEDCLLDPDGAERIATLNNLAVLHEDCLLDPDGVKRMRALEVGPEDVTSLCNYAGFLRKTREDEAGAEALIDKARGVDRAMADRLIQAHEEADGEDGTEGGSMRKVPSDGPAASEATFLY